VHRTFIVAVYAIVLAATSITSGFSQTSGVASQGAANTASTQGTASSPAAGQPAGGVSADYRPQPSANQGIGIGDRTVGRANQGIGVAGPRTLGSANQGIGINRGSAAGGGMFTQPQRNFLRGSAGVPGRTMFSGQGAFFGQGTASGQGSLSARGTPENMGAIAGAPLNAPLPNVQDNTMIVPDAVPQFPPTAAPAGAAIDGRVTIDDLYRRTQPDGFPRRVDQGFGLAFDDEALHDRQSGSLSVRQVTPGSLAAAAGLRTGDQVLAIDGRRFSSPHDALNYLDARLAANAATEVTVNRDGRQTVLTASPERAGVDVQNGAIENTGGGGLVASSLGVSFADGARGLTVAEVSPSSAAAVADLMPNDRLLSIDGRRFASSRDAIRYLENRQASSPLDVWVLRDRRAARISVDTQSHVDRRAAPGVLGVTFDDSAVNFAPILQVAPNSAAERAGLRSGDDIVSIDGQLMTNYKDVLAYLETRRAGDRVELTIRRDNRNFSLDATLGPPRSVSTAQERVPTSRRRI
jgi:S1-C subfamily serine protease